jgi:hypothetical protein
MTGSRSTRDVSEDSTNNAGNGRAVGGRPGHYHRSGRDVLIADVAGVGLWDMATRRLDAPAFPDRAPEKALRVFGPPAAPALPATLAPGTPSRERRTRIA